MAAGALVSKPSQLHANLVPKRNKMMQQEESEGSDRNASGYVTYKIEDNLRLIARRNATDERNKVYTAIIFGAKKGSTEKLVRGSTDKSIFDDNNIGYAAEAEIDPTSSRPTVKVKFTTK
ncbi:hypothetical protein PVK06_016691 [Gossypium arboreum]|uniref:Uncharacterized protein n=1 Tax=Gossypium arboreum TaxID=29729 RepID=A0ABR0Q0M3_GOSAR|nr:hypothetical protein PVK06_016691 [Gossypium arboreum]